MGVTSGKKKKSTKKPAVKNKKKSTKKPAVKNKKKSTKKPVAAKEKKKKARKKKTASKEKKKNETGRGRAKRKSEPMPMGSQKKDYRWPEKPKLSKKVYEKALSSYQVELVRLQKWIQAEGLRVVIIFEGRDAAGKGGTIKRITQSLNPRVCRVVALAKPTERERTQWYFQRYVAHLPAAGEMVLFDRSWYNRAGVERVMGFCSESEYKEFLRSCPEFERMLVRSGIKIIKYWFSVSDEEQERRFLKRIGDPVRRWKISEMDLQSRSHWVDYSRAKDEMFAHTDIKQAPWFVAHGDDKRRARLNVIDHLLDQIHYDRVPEPMLELPPRQKNTDYIRPPLSDQSFVPDVY